jgi:hypothetical protein
LRCCCSKNWGKFSWSSPSQFGGPIFHWRVASSRRIPSVRGLCFMQAFGWMEGQANCLIAEVARQHEKFTQTQFWADKTILGRSLSLYGPNFTLQKWGQLKRLGQKEAKWWPRNGANSFEQENGLPAEVLFLVYFLVLNHSYSFHVAP